MIKKIKSIADKVLLKEQLYQKQRLYAQMMKDKVNGPVLQKLSEEIGQINANLYNHGQRKQ